MPGKVDRISNSMKQRCAPLSESLINCIEAAKQYSKQTDESPTPKENFTSSVNALYKQIKLFWFSLYCLLCAYYLATSTAKKILELENKERELHDKLEELKNQSADNLKEATLTSESGNTNPENSRKYKQQEIKIQQQVRKAERQLQITQTKLGKLDIDPKPGSFPYICIKLFGKKCILNAKKQEIFSDNFAEIKASGQDFEKIFSPKSLAYKNLSAGEPIKVIRHFFDTSIDGMLSSFQLYLKSGIHILPTERKCVKTVKYIIIVLQDLGKTAEDSEFSDKLLQAVKRIGNDEKQARDALRQEDESSKRNKEKMDEILKDEEELKKKKLEIVEAQRKKAERKLGDAKHDLEFFELKENLVKISVKAEEFHNSLKNFAGEIKTNYGSDTVTSIQNTLTTELAKFTDGGEPSLILQKQQWEVLDKLINESDKLKGEAKSALTDGVIFKDFSDDFLMKWYTVVHLIPQDGPEIAKWFQNSYSQAGGNSTELADSFALNQKLFISNNKKKKLSQFNTHIDNEIKIFTSMKDSLCKKYSDFIALREKLGAKMQEVNDFVLENANASVQLQTELISLVETVDFEQYTGYLNGQNIIKGIKLSFLNFKENQFDVNYLFNQDRDTSPEGGYPTIVNGWVENIFQPFVNELDKLINKVIDYHLKSKKFLGKNVGNINKSDLEGNFNERKAKFKEKKRNVKNTKNELAEVTKQKQENLDKLNDTRGKEETEIAEGIMQLNKSLWEIISLEDEVSFKDAQVLFTSSNLIELQKHWQDELYPKFVNYESKYRSNAADIEHEACKDLRTVQNVVLGLCTPICNLHQFLCRQFTAIWRAQLENLRDSEHHIIEVKNSDTAAEGTIEGLIDSHGSVLYWLLNSLENFRPKIPQYPENTDAKSTNELMMSALTADYDSSKKLSFKDSEKLYDLIIKYYPKLEVTVSANPKAVRNANSKMSHGQSLKDDLLSLNVVTFDVDGEIVEFLVASNAVASDLLNVMCDKYGENWYLEVGIDVTQKTIDKIPSSLEGSACDILNAVCKQHGIILDTVLTKNNLGGKHILKVPAKAREYLSDLIMLLDLEEVTLGLTAKVAILKKLIKDVLSKINFNELPVHYLGSDLNTLGAAAWVKILYVKIVTK